MHLAALAAGPGSPQQQHLFCVLISLLKVLQSSACLADNSVDSTLCCTLAFGLLADMLQSCHMSGPAAVGVAANTSMLPWLLLLGRCCLYVSAQTASR